MDEEWWLVNDKGNDDDDGDDDDDNDEMSHGRWRNSDDDTNAHVCFDLLCEDSWLSALLCEDSWLRTRILGWQPYKLQSQSNLGLPKDFHQRPW